MDKFSDFSEETESNFINKKEDKNKNHLLNTFFEFLKGFVISLIIVFVFNFFVAEVNIVSGNSMFPTLHDRDRVIVEKISLNFRELKRGDIITIDGNKLKYSNLDKFIIKRVVALPGEEVEIKNSELYINGEKLTEPYLSDAIATINIGDFDHVKLKDDEYYCLGDNREHSGDSRIYGPINKEAIRGRMIFRFWPFASFGFVN